MGKVISLANQKGGSGKTTLCVNLSVLWSNSEYKIAIIDADKQRSLTNWYDSRKKYYGDNDTGISIFKYNAVDHSEMLKDLKKNFDIILIDSPPSISMDSITIVRNSNYVVVPVQPSPLDILATIPFLDLIKKEKKSSKVVLNRILARAKLTEAMALRLRYSGAKILRTKISSRVLYAETFNVGRGVIDISVVSSASKEIIKLGNEILKNI